ncbi:MAG: hypothetical protein HC778_03620 [Chamaesiphon sp. CSU_1_12]|nr:hypothetical protein [Chamaesiphon sp. CSU_1_12]
MNLYYWVRQQGDNRDKNSARNGAVDIIYGMCDRFVDIGYLAAAAIDLEGRFSKVLHSLL